MTGNGTRASPLPVVRPQGTDLACLSRAAFSTLGGGTNPERLLGYADDIMCWCGNESCCSGRCHAPVCTLPSRPVREVLLLPPGTTRLNNLPNSTSTIIDDSCVFITFPLQAYVNLLCQKKMGTLLFWHGRT